MRSLSAFRPVSVAALFLSAALSVPAQEPEDPVGLPAEEDPVFKLFEELDAAFQAHETNAVNTRFEAAIEDPVFAEIRPNLFENYLVYLLRTEQVEGAKKFYLGTLRTDLELARPSSGLIYGFLFETGRSAEALDWARTLLAQEIPEDFRMAATEWLAGGLYAAGDAPKALETALSGLKEFSAEAFAPILVRLGETALGRRPEDGGPDAAFVQSLVDALGEAAEGAEPYAVAEAGLRLRLLAAQGEYAKVAELVPELHGRLPDGAFVSSLSAVLRSAERTGHADAIDPIVSAVVLDERFADLPALRRLASREWVRAVFRDPDAGPAAFPGRMDKLLRLGLPAEHLFSLYTRFFYDVVQDLDALRAVQPVAEAIRARLSDPADLEAFRTYDLDTAFLLEDYDRALSLIEQGIPDHDADWHAMMKSKLVAHRAMAAGEWSAAAAAFEDFLARLPEEDQIDPTTDVTFSRTTLCANNHRRIGDLWLKAGDRDKARAAYETARAEYAQAIENNKAGPATAEYLAAQAASLEEAAAALNP